jgi:CRP/FNR family transcriptional regulator
MMGEVIGLDAIGGSQHASDAVALEHTDVCVIPFAALESLSHDMPALQRKLYYMMSQEIQYEREAMLLLGTIRAEDRVASFLLNLGRRYEARGFSALRFLLRMSRAEIGSYLGLRLETVSRLFSKFEAEGLLRVDSKSLEILDPDGLKLVIGRSLN